MNAKQGNQHIMLAIAIDRNRVFAIMSLFF